MFVVANWRRLEMCGVGKIDAYVMGLSRRMRDMGVHVCLRKRGEMEGVGTHK